MLPSKGLEKEFFQNILWDDSELERAPEGLSPYGISFADVTVGKDLLSPDWGLGSERWHKPDEVSERMNLRER